MLTSRMKACERLLLCLIIHLSPTLWRTSRIHRSQRPRPSSTSTDQRRWLRDLAAIRACQASQKLSFVRDRTTPNNRLRLACRLAMLTHTMIGKLRIMDNKSMSINSKQLAMSMMAISKTTRFIINRKGIRLSARHLCEVIEAKWSVPRSGSNRSKTCQFPITESL